MHKIIALPLCVLFVLTLIEAKSNSAFQASHVAGKLASKVASPKACSAAGLDHLRTCIINYVQPFWLGSTLTNIPSYWDFHRRRLEYLIMGELDAQRDVCRYVNSMNTCESLIESQCVNIASLMQLGLSQEDATDYVIDHDISIFECGPGYNTLVANYRCLTDTALTATSALQMCEDQMSHSIANDPAHLCNTFNTYVACETVIYRNACGQAAGNLICNVTVIGIMAGSQHVCDGQLQRCNPLPPKAANAIPLDWLKKPSAFIKH